MGTTAVCIVNYNTRDLLRACLRSVLSERPGEITLIDNASTDGSVEMVQEEFPSVRLIRLDGNLGYGAAANRAVENCRSDYVLLLNSDTLLKPGALEALSSYLDKHELASMIGPQIVSPDGKIQTSRFYFPTPLHVFLYLSNWYRFIPRLPIARRRSLQAASASPAIMVPWVLGAALAFRRERFETIGGFDEEFFMYFEEVDLCYRLSTAGEQIHFAPVAEIVHVGGSSTDQERVEMNLQFFASLARFYRKHYSELRLSMLILLVEGFALLWLVRDRFSLLITRDQARRSRLHENLGIYQRLLLGAWSGSRDPRTVVPA